MAAEETSKQSPPRRRWPPAEKRRLVELTLRAGASVGAVADEHGVNRTSLSHWRALYRAGTLDAQAQPPARPISASRAIAAFVPVNLARAGRRRPPATCSDAVVSGSGVVELILASGATLRIEAATLDTALVCALVAELRR